jgi:hypothetical protein
MWLEELKKKPLAKVKPPLEAPPKEEIEDFEPKIPLLDKDMHPVRLGESLKSAWIWFGGPRTQVGYRDVEVFDKPLCTEAGIVAVLTVLEASIIEDVDFKKLKGALLAHIRAHPELEEKNLKEVVDKLPIYLSRSFRYNLTLFRYRRPDFDNYTLREQIDLLDHHRNHINQFLKAQRNHLSFLEYGTYTGRPTRVVEHAQKQVTATVLKDVQGLPHIKLADVLRIEKPEKYKDNGKIPEIEKLIRDGRRLLDNALKSEGGWKNRAEKMKFDMERYNSLRKREGKVIADLVENKGWNIEEARSFCERNPRMWAEFLTST